MKKSPLKALGLVSILAFASCTGNPEGAFNSTEKNKQDSLDSLSNEALFDDLKFDSPKPDSVLLKSDKTSTVTLPKTDPENTPISSQ